MKRVVNIVTLGCSKNVVDSEHLAAQLEAEGYEVLFDSNSPEAKTVIINTCGFIGDAKEESVDTILNFAGAKDEGLIDNLYVFGCLCQRYKDELTLEIPEVDQFFGVNDLEQIVEVVGASYRKELETSRKLTTPSHYAYLKISEGCNWGCAYCIIPHIRGSHRSVAMEELLREAEALVANGVKELIVIAQDTTYYGIDIYGERKLGELLKKLCRIEGLEWVRLHYAYPTAFPDDVIEVMASETKICKYLDIPFQHISDGQLKSMKRGITKKQTLGLIDKLRTGIPDIALRTTLLVGYPGETEADFEELMDFVREVRFERLGVFPYSPEEGTYSADRLADDVSQQVKESRVDRIMTLQSTISLSNNEQKVGKRIRVVIDNQEGDYYIARTQYDSPEVDNEILISSSKELKKGDFCDILITGAEDYDLYGEL